MAVNAISTRIKSLQYTPRIDTLVDNFKGSFLNMLHLVNQIKRINTEMRYFVYVKR